MIGERTYRLGTREGEQGMNRNVRLLAVCVLVAAVALIALPAPALADNLVASGTLIFEGALTDHGDGTYTGTVAMIDEATASLGDTIAGFDVYARNGAYATYDQAGSGTDYACGVIVGYDAYTTAGGWGVTYDPDCADWYNYQLRLEAGQWYLEYNAGVGNDGILTGAVGAPMSGNVDWAAGYAAETGAGAYYAGMGTAESSGYALDNTCTGINAGVASWDMDWSWGSEYIPLEHPGFDVTVDDLGGGNFRVTLTPAVGPVENLTTGMTYATIQAAIDAASAGDTISASAGVYNESLNIDKGLTLQSAAGAAATTIAATGTTAVTIDADNVMIDGFTVTNPAGKHGIVATDHSDLTIVNNIITDIGSSDSTTSGTNFGLAIVSSAAAVNNIAILDNQINYIAGGSFKSVDGIAIGWSNGSESVTGLTIQGNAISHITSDTGEYAAGGRGAYGILINHTTSSSGQTIAPQILNNTITDLEALWVHGIGLEGDTPNALVQGNTISHLVDYKSPADPDAAAIMVEDNASADTVTIYENSFSDTWFGVRNVTALTVNASGNWWGSADAATVAGMVNANVDYTPWLGDGADFSGDPGFQGDFSALWADDDSPQTGATGRIQEAVDLASGSTVYVAPGMYTERIVVDKPLTILGATHTVNKNGYTVPVDYAWDTNVESVISYPDPSGLDQSLSQLVDIRSSDVTFMGFVVQVLNARCGFNGDNLFRVDAGGAGSGTLDNIVVENNVLGPATNVTSQDGTCGRMNLYLASPTYPADYQGITNSLFAGNKIFGAEGNGNNVFVWGAAESYGFGPECGLLRHRHRGQRDIRGPSQRNRDRRWRQQPDHSQQHHSRR